MLKSLEENHWDTEENIEFRYVLNLNFTKNIGIYPNRIRLVSGQVSCITGVSNYAKVL